MRLFLVSVCLLVLVAAMAAPASAASREYWIAADEVLWDFAPSFPINKMQGVPFNEDQLVFVDDFIGRVYLKSIYREYTPNFEELKMRGPEETHLGILGPIIRGEVGDTITVHFRNNTRFPASMHPHGVFYQKAFEGTPYDDGSPAWSKGDDAVPSGSSYDYFWEVPERAGPGPNDPNSIVWEYHSHVDETQDTNSGLIGPIIITRRGFADADGRPTDVDAEFISLYTIFNENSSNYLETNIELFCPDCGDLPEDEEEEFEESNLMHSINGYVFGNNVGYDMVEGDKVRWYIIGMGTEVDIHSPHWHGVTCLHNGIRLDVAEVLPAASKTFDLDADNPGTWMFHCHVNDHIDAGMMTTFTIH